MHVGNGLDYDPLTDGKIHFNKCFIAVATTTLTDGPNFRC